MEFVPLMAMALLVFQVINFVRYLKAGDTNGIVTTVAVWVAGVSVVFLVAQTDFARSITITDTTLANLNAWSLLFVGLTVSSIGNFANEALGAVDANRTTQKPQLVDE